MVRVRKLVLAIAAASTLTSGVAHALGLGEVTMQSALNQPLVAEIELLEVRGLGSEDLIPALASPEAFNRAGVDRQYFLTDLKFTPVIKPNGKSVIRVTSSKPIREPYLNFLVELHWPNGRLLREYTMLLDPPLYRPEPVLSAPVRAAVSAPSAAPVRNVQSSVAPRAVATPTRSAPSAPRSAPQASADGTYRVSSSDTLWDVASRVSGGSVNQAMLAIQDLNPNAFIGGNINRMKSGQVLRLPTEEQVRSRSQAEAQAQVAEQNAAWRERRDVAAPARQLDATRRSSAGAAPAQAAASDNLRLVAGDSGKATSGSDSAAGTGSAGLEDKLAVAQETLESTRRENAELEARMGDLESRLDKLQRLMQLKDDQLAKLQADLGEAAQQAPAELPVATEQQASPSPDAAAPEAPVAATAEAETPTVGSTPEQTPPVDAGVGVAATDETGAAATAGSLPAAVEPEADGAAAPAEPGSEAPAAETETSTAVAEQPVVAPQEALPADSEAPAEVAPQPKAPADSATASASGSFMDELLNNSTFLTVLGGGAALLLLLALMMLSRRNAQREAELHESLAAQQSFEDEKPAQSNFDLDADASDAELAEAAAQSGDVLDEADIYIAYGRFNQAAELLQGAISEEPERNDLRLKLMEVYAELGDRDGFKREEAELHEMGGSHPEVERLKARYPAMIAATAAAGASAVAASNLEDDFDLDDLGLDDSELDGARPATNGELDDAFDLSLAELEADLEAPAALPTNVIDDELELSRAFEAPAVAAQPAGDDPLADFDLDFDASSDAPQAGEAAVTVLEEDFAADLELPEDFDLSLSEPQAPADQASEDFLADLAAADAELSAFSSDLDSGSMDIEAPAAVDGDDDFDFLSGTDETATKLDLARAYIDMGDSEGARDILDEVLNEGSDVQQNEARELLARLV